MRLYELVSRLALIYSSEIRSDIAKSVNSNEGTRQSVHESEIERTHVHICFDLIFLYIFTEV